MTEIIGATPEQTKIIEKRLKQTEQYVSRVEVVDIIDNDKNLIGQIDHDENIIKMTKLDNEKFEKVFLHELAHKIITYNSEIKYSFLKSRNGRLNTTDGDFEKYIIKEFDSFNYNLVELICDCFAVELYKTDEKLSPRLFAKIKGTFVKSVNQGRFGLELF